MTNPKEIASFSSDDVLIRDVNQLHKFIDTNAPAERKPQQRERLLRSNNILLSRKKHEINFHYPLNLPICTRLDEIAESIKHHQVTLICSGTGSGKSTQIPKKCLQMGFGIRGQIGHTQPRRIAARSVAARISAEIGSRLGEAVGSQVRFDKQVGEHSRLKIMTDGILLEEIRRDRMLLRYDLLIIDEVHERSTNIDFLLGYLPGVLRKRPELRVVLMSATADQAPLERALNAKLIEVEGKQFPVEVRYREFDEEDKTELEGIDQAIRELNPLRGDILIFLPGEREIHEAAQHLNGRGFTNTAFLPLYGRLPSQAQSKVFETSSNRRVILATNVAETSLTIPGVRHVIDSGLARISRYNPRSKLLELPITEISQAAARQRAGRCGREAPGICIRLYSEENFLSREEFTKPEILRTNLANSILKCASLNLGHLERFPLPDPPSQRLIKDGKNLLREIAAIDASDAITAVGRLLAKLPVDARLGRFLLAAHESRQFNQALIIVAAISVGDCRLRPTDRREEAEAAHGKFTDVKSDLLFFLKLWTELGDSFIQLSRREKRLFCQQNFLSLQKLQQWIDLHRQLGKQCAALGLAGNGEELSYKNLHSAFLVGFASLIGVKNKTGEYTGARGISFMIHPRSSVKRNKPPFLVCLERFETTSRYADVVAKVEPVWVVKAAPHLIKSSYSKPSWDRERGKAFAFRTQRIFGVQLGHPKRVAFTKIDPTESRKLFIEQGLVNYELDRLPSFLQSNRDTFVTLEDFERKLRRQLVPSEQALYAFYDACIPADVATLSGMNAWLVAHPLEAEKLYYPMAEELDGVSQHVRKAYPDRLRVRDLEFGVRYEFEPAQDNDGLTITIPAALLPRLPINIFDTLCPGLLSEKIATLAKVLPKSCRKKIAPLAEFVDFVQREVRAEPLEDTFCRCYFKQCGEELDRSAFAKIALPNHLIAHVEIVDEVGNTENQSSPRFYPSLVAAQSAESAPSAKQGNDDPLLSSWQLRELNLIKESVIGGNRLYDYAAFVDFGTGVKVRYFRTESVAEQMHRHGVARLAMLSNARKWSNPKLEDRNFLLMCSALGLRTDDLAQIHKAAYLALLLTGDPPRTMQDFDTFIVQSTPQLESSLTVLSDGLVKLITLAFAVKKRLNNEIQAQWPAEFEYINRQIAYLFSAEAIGVMRVEWQTAYMRYLKGMERRIERLALDPAKDRKKAEPLAELSASWWALWQQSASRACEHLQLYLALEELHLKQFAPELATNQKVHPMKLLSKIQDLLEGTDLGT